MAFSCCWGEAAEPQTLSLRAWNSLPKARVLRTRSNSAGDDYGDQKSTADRRRGNTINCTGAGGGDDASSSSPGPRSRKTVGRCSAVKLSPASRSLASASSSETTMGRLSVTSISITARTGATLRCVKTHSLTIDMLRSSSTRPKSAGRTLRARRRRSSALQLPHELNQIVLFLGSEFEFQDQVEELHRVFQCQEPAVMEIRWAVLDTPQRECLNRSISCFVF